MPGREGEGKDTRLLHCSTFSSDGYKTAASEVLQWAPNCNIDAASRTGRGASLIKTALIHISLTAFFLPEVDLLGVTIFVWLWLVWVFFLLDKVARSQVLVEVFSN